MKLSREHALRLAQISTAASTEAKRGPVLASVQLTFADGRLEATCTDSYRLAVFSIFGAAPPYEGSGQVALDVDHELLVPAVEFGEAIKGILKLTPKEVKGKADDGIELIPNMDYHHQVTIKGLWKGRPSVVVTDNTGAAIYPKWRPFFDGQSYDGRDRFGDPDMSTVNEGTTLPRFSSQYLADMDKLMGTTQALKKKMMPWQITVTSKTLSDPAKGDYQPWAFATRSTDMQMGITYLLMPINPNIHKN